MKGECLISTLKRIIKKYTVVLNGAVRSASADCTFTVLEDDLHQRNNKLSCVQCLLTGASNTISVTHYGLSVPLR